MYYTVVPCVENDFRLMGGTNTSGRIEVCVDGQWGKICSESFDDKTAAMVCKQIGLKGKTGLSHFGFLSINMHL